MHATEASKEFARDSAAVTMEASTKDGPHVLFTIYPEDEEKSAYIMKVATPYLSSLVMQQIANFDAIDQLSFYHKASTLPLFKGTMGYIFERYFFVWLSAKQGISLTCTAKTRRSAVSTADNLTHRASRVEKVNRSQWRLSIRGG